MARKERLALRLIEESKMIEEARHKRQKSAQMARRKKDLETQQMEAARIAAREKGLQEIHQKISTKKREKAEEDARLAQELKEIKL